MTTNATQGNYLLDTLTLQNFDGSQVFNLKGYVQSIAITESIYENILVGSIGIKDASGMPQYLPIVGEELLTISFQTSVDAAIYSKQFRVYKMSDLSRDANVSTGSIFTLHFVSVEFFTNESTRVYRGYKNMLTSDIVADIFKTYIKSPKVFVPEVTAQAQQIVIPSMKPFQAINMLTSYSQLAGKTSTFFLFYENADGFKFTNIESLYTSDPVATYTVTPANTNSDSATKTVSDFIPLAINLAKGFDRLDSVARGMVANTVEGVDLLAKSSTTNTYNYQAQFSSSTHIESSGYPLLSNASTDTQSQSYKLVNSRSLRSNSNYFKKNDTSGVSFSKTYEQYLPYRTSVYLQANSIEISGVVSGNTDIKAGSIIVLNLDNRTAFDNNDIYHPYLAGRFLVKSLTHSLQGKYFYTKLTLVKDCYKKKISGTPNFDVTQHQDALIS